MLMAREEFDAMTEELFSRGWYVPTQFRRNMVERSEGNDRMHKIMPAGECIAWAKLLASGIHVVGFEVDFRRMTTGYEVEPFGVVNVDPSSDPRAVGASLDEAVVIAWQLKVL